MSKDTSMDSLQYFDQHSVVSCRTGSGNVMLTALLTMGAGTGASDFRKMAKKDLFNQRKITVPLFTKDFSK